MRQACVISIVDDNESARESTRSLIRSLGHLAFTFSSAEEFLNSDSVRKTSCLITDIQMPGMSGIELQRRLIAEGIRIPIIFITGFPETSLRARVLEAGAVGFLSKPFEESSLIGCLDAALKNQNAGSGDE